MKPFLCKILYLLNLLWYKNNKNSGSSFQKYQFKDLFYQKIVNY